MALSPRAILRCKNYSRDKRQHHFSDYLITCCAVCQRIVHEDEKLPLYGIINKNYVGCTPACLLSLTEIEVAMLTPIKCYGFCYSYIGGTQTNLRGTLTFMHTKQNSTAWAVLQLDTMGLRNDVLVLAHGNMTPNQYENCKNKAKIRVDKVLLAVEWLVQNHLSWKTVILDDIRRDLEHTKPLFFDMSKRCPAENANVEETELFEAYYPDGTATSQEGGFETAEDFRACVEELKLNGYDLSYKCNLQRNFLTRGDHGFVDSLLLQFPFGLGGFEDSRLQLDGSHEKLRDISSYLVHLTKLSQPVFQKPLFQLIAFNYICKEKILATARFQIKSPMSASAIAAGVITNDLRLAVQYRRNGFRNAGSRVSCKILDACDATGRALPQTNEAAGVARYNGEAMQHHFGIASIWLTVSFDDKNSWLMQVFSGIRVDGDTDIAMLTDKECHQLCTNRNKIRLDYPGLAALNFEASLEILMEEVIGWDMRNNKRQ